MRVCVHPCVRERTVEAMKSVWDGAPYEGKGVRGLRRRLRAKGAAMATAVGVGLHCSVRLGRGEGAGMYGFACG